MQYLERNFEEDNEPSLSTNKATGDESDTEEESLQTTLLQLVRRKKYRHKIERIIEVSGPRILTECDLLLLLRSAEGYNNFALFAFILDSKSKIDIELPDLTSLISSIMDEDWAAAWDLYGENVDEIISRLCENRKKVKSRNAYEFEWKERGWAKSIVASSVVSTLTERGWTIARIANVFHEFCCEINLIVDLGNPDLTRAFLQIHRPQFQTTELLPIFAIFVKNTDTRHLEVFLDYNYNLPEQRIMAWEVFSLLMKNMHVLDRSEAGRTFIKILPRYEFFYHERALERIQDSLVLASRENIEILLNYEFREAMMSRCNRDLITAAYGNRNPAVLELMKTVEVDLNARGFARFTPLHFAAYMHAKENVRYLLQKGADPNALDELGDTTLNLALEFQYLSGSVGNRECVKLLLMGGADPILTYKRRSFFGFSIYGKRQFNLKNIAKYLAAQIAVEEVLGREVEELVEAFMKQSGGFDCAGFYEGCLKKLAKMKGQKFRDDPDLNEKNFNMFAILSGRKDQIARRIDENDRRVIAEFVKEYEKEEMFYHPDALKYRLEIIDRMMTSIDATRRILSECMQISDLRHVVIDQVLDYLSYRDLLTWK